MLISVERTDWTQLLRDWQEEVVSGVSSHAPTINRETGLIHPGPSPLINQIKSSVAYQPLIEFIVFHINKSAIECPKNIEMGQSLIVDNMKHVKSRNYPELSPPPNFLIY